MTAITGALCAGQPELFEATDVHSHREAKAICDMCPALLACRELLHDEPRKYGTPSGTWAGMLLVLGKKVTPQSKSKPREHGTTRGYYQHKNRNEDACDQCREASRIDKLGRSRKKGPKRVDESAGRTPVRGRIQETERTPSRVLGGPQAEGSDRPMKEAG